MNLNEKNLELQVQIWALIGPVIALATVITLYFHGASQNIVLSFAVLVGTLSCWWWKTKGLIGALVGIILLGAYQFLNQPSSDPLWNVGITFAIALTFLVTALSFEEVETIVEGIQSESSSRLKSLLKLDEKLERVQSKLQEEKKSLLTTVKERENELKEQEMLLTISRDEIFSTHRKHEELLSEIYSLKLQHQRELQHTTHVSISEESLKQIEDMSAELTLARDELVVQAEQSHKEIEHLRAELQLTKNALLDQAGYGEIELEVLKNQLAQTKKDMEFAAEQANADLSRLKAELQRSNHQLVAQAEQAKAELEFLREEFAETQKNQLEQWTQAKNQLTDTAELATLEAQHLKEKLATTQERLRLEFESSNIQLRDESYLAKTELAHAKTELASVKNNYIEALDKSEAEIARLKAELAAQPKEIVVNPAEAESRELRRINGMYCQLRVQFEEKSATLDSTRQELFLTQERLSRELMEQKERQYEGTEFEKELQRCLDEMEQEQRELQLAHQREVDQLQEIISQMMCLC